MLLIKSLEGLQIFNSITYPSIEIKKNSFTFITGKSGCGKSSYLKILNRTLIPSNNCTFYYKDKNAYDIPVLSYRKVVMLIPQDVFLFESNIRDNFNHYYDARCETRLTDDEMLKFLHICCVDFDLNRDCKKLSGGEKQRVFLAIFLSCTPEVLLLDEPTSALDSKTSTKLMSNIKEFCRENKITVVCICHSHELIEKFSDFTIEIGGY